MAHDINGKARTKDVYLDPGLDFDGMLLPENILEGLRNNGFKRPSPIQIKAIPLGRCGFDMVMQAKSGTGKTVVFGIISLETVKPTSKTVQVIILVPTREIAVQIKEVLSTIGSGITGLNVQSFIGGLPIAEDIENVKKCHIAVGAPGRIKHLIELGHLKVNGVQLLVLDEADKLVDGTFLSDVEFIFSKLPKTKQVIASSATYLDSVDSFLSRFMNSPTYVKATNDVPILIGVRQFVSVVKSSMNVIKQLQVKTNELIRIISTVSFKQCLVFTNYQTRAESISNNLNSLGWATSFMSGNQTQKDRLKAISNLKNFKCRVLLSTDLTSRGIDVESVNLVINYDVPYNVATYLHRIGRAGRFGSYGMAITIVGDGTELENFRNMISYLGDEFSVIKFPTKNMPSCIWNCDFDNFEKVYAKKLIQIDPRHNLKSESSNLSSKVKNNASLNENEQCAENDQLDIQNGNLEDKSDQSENVEAFERKGIDKQMKETQMKVGTNDAELLDLFDNGVQKSEFLSFEDIMKEKTNLKETEEIVAEISCKTDGINDDKLLDLLKNEFEKSELPEKILSFEDIMKEETYVKETEESDLEIACTTDVKLEIVEKILKDIKQDFEFKIKDNDQSNDTKVLKLQISENETEQSTSVIRTKELINSDNGMPMKPNLKQKLINAPNQTKEIADEHLLETTQNVIIAISKMYELIKAEQEKIVKFESFEDIVKSISQNGGTDKSISQNGGTDISISQNDSADKFVSQNGGTETVSSNVCTKITDDVLKVVENFLKLSKKRHKEISLQIEEKYKHVSPRRIAKCLINQQPITKRSSPRKSKKQSPKNVPSNSYHENEVSYETHYQSSGETPIQKNLSKFYSYDDFALNSSEINANHNQNLLPNNSTINEEFPQNNHPVYDYHNVPSFYPHYNYNNAYQNNNPNFASNLWYRNQESNYICNNLSNDSWYNMWVSQIMHVRKYVQNVAICQQKIRSDKTDIFK